MKDLSNTALWTALITPMHADGQIDFAGLTRCVHEQEAAGNGVLLLGSTGEGLALTTAEKQQVVEHVVNLQVKVPLMVGVGGAQLPEQLAWMAFCEQQAIDAYLLVTPLYAKPGPKGQIAWFKALMDTASKPCMLYNVPSRTGVDMHVDVLKALSGHQRLWAVKEASGALADFQAYQQANEELAFFSGEDGLMPELGGLGAVGLVSVISNVWPQATHAYVKAAFAETLSTEEVALWKTASAALFSVSNPIPAKALLVYKGWFASPALRLPLLADELTDMSPLLAADQAVENWLATGSKS